jgi:uncharacterized protein YjbI with pentapeptide repeats
MGSRPLRRDQRRIGTPCGSLSETGMHFSSVNSSVLATVAIGIAVAAALLGSWWLWWRLPKRQADRLRLAIRDRKARADVEDNFRKTISQLLGGAAVLIGAGLAYLQFSQQQQASHDLLASNQVAKGLEQLGNEKIVVRLGGIYALEGVMNTSEQYHQPVLEALSAFVREGTKTETGDGPPATDIQAVLTVIGRRKEIGSGNPGLANAHIPKADLSRADLNHANLSYANLSYANLRQVNLSSANLSYANLRHAYLTGGADLSYANLSGANLTGAYPKGADLTGADLTDAVLRDAHLSQADLSYADLTGADLTAADLSDANLSHTYPQGANLSRAYLSGANLSGANLSGAILSRAAVSQGQLDQACGTDVKLDPGLSLKECLIPVEHGPPD